MAWTHIGGDLDDPALWPTLKAGMPGRDTTLLRHGNSRRVYALRQPDGSRLIVKYWYQKGWTDQVKSVWRESAPAQEYRMTCLAHARGLPTRPPLAFAENRRLGALREAAVIHPHAGFSTTFADCFRAHADQPDALARLTTLFLDTLATIHLAGILHGDYKGDNLLTQPRPREPGAYDVTCIDWGLAREITPYDPEHCHTELLKTAAYLWKQLNAFRSPQRDSHLRQALQHYADRLAAAPQPTPAELPATILAQVDARIRQSNRRLHERALKPARRLEQRRAGPHTLYLLKARVDDPDAVAAAIAADDATYTLRPLPDADAIWRATCVLLNMDLLDSPILGFTHTPAGLALILPAHAPDPTPTLITAAREWL